MIDVKSPVELILEPFGDDLWLNRRLLLDEVLTKLNDSLETLDGTNRTAIQDQMRFIEFLKSDCSGLHYSNDKQWSQLLNLMQISRKLNHKSVKFRDILKNKSLIESSAREIKEFNEFVRMSHTIGELIKDLEKNLQSSQLNLPPGAGASRFEHDDVTRDAITEVTRARNHLETTIMPAMHSLRLNLQSELVVREHESQQYADWLSSLDRFAGTADRLEGFLCNYLDLKKHLLQLKPLVGSLNSTCDHTASKVDQNNQFLVNSLGSCKVMFDKILDFNHVLERNLDKLSKSSSLTSRQVVKSRTSKVIDQQADRSVKLQKLLDPKTFKFVSADYGENLTDALRVADECRQTLDQVMSTLRLEFGRFYFVNNLELLTIISLDSKLVEDCEQLENQMLIRKLFHNSIEKFLLDSEAKSVKQRSVVGVQTPLGERIMLAPGQGPVPLRKRVNIYSLEIVRILNEIIRKLQRSLRSVLIESLSSGDSSEINWSLPMQMLNLSEQLKFTQLVETNISNLDPVRLYYERRIEQMSSGELQRSSSQLETLKKSEAISLTVHFISILIDLSSFNVNSVHDWHWQKLARYYHCGGSREGEEEIQVRIANSHFSYKFDLLAVEMSSSSSASLEPNACATKRLIHTNTSRRCFLVASQAIGQFKSGLNPFGPAGSGKTETIKALGQMLGCQVIVHNCDETNDLESLERLIWGLAHSGLWGCFDEFNRLSSSTLSSISALLERVQTSLRERKITLELEGGQIKSIDQDSAFFITMNPGDSSKYQGRRRLPANLRSLFLPVAMINVQIDSIVRETLLVHRTTSQRGAGPGASSNLAAEGPREIGLALANWVAWMRSNLIVNRCEWDLRLIMVVLKRFKLIDVSTGDQSPLMKVVHSILLEVSPRLTEHELRVLNKSFEEVFQVRPDVVVPNLSLTEQIESQLSTRSGLILLGSEQVCSSLELMGSCLTQREGRVKWFALNPKSLSRDELFGRFVNEQDSSSGQPQAKTTTSKWVDGLFTHIVRKCLGLLHDADKSNDQQVWIILDGSIDPDWVESLNSVLDDNRVLTLSSGERLSFVQGQKSIKLLFATGNIAFASPATISRLGLIYLTNANGDRPSVSLNEIRRKLIIAVKGCCKSVDATSFIGDQKSADNTLEYNCSANSTSKELLQILELTKLLRGEHKSLVINNLRLIDAEDKWGTRTLIELLRFVVTYGFYYDREFNIQEVPQGTQFVVTTNSADDKLGDCFPPSLVSETVQLKGEPASSVGTTIRPEELSVLITSEQQEGISLIEVRDGQTQCLLNRLLAQPPADVEFCKFDCHPNVIQSLDKLLKLTPQRELRASVTSKVASEAKRWTFVLDSMQYKLINSGDRARLCHLLNLIKFARSKINFFILFGSAGSGSIHDEPDYRFWRSMVGTTSNLFVLEPTRYDEPFIGRHLFDGHDERRTNSESKQVKILSALPEQYPISETFLSMLTRMTKTVKLHIEQRRKMFTDSLGRLKQFEESIEEIKVKKIEDEKRLAERRSEIEALLSQMSSEVEAGKQRSTQIDIMKEALNQKNEELAQSKKRIQGELSNVIPAIESSRAEVSQHLKPEALNEIRTLRSPPKTIKDILDVLLIFLDPSTPSLDWAAMKTYLTRYSLRDQMTNYDFQARLNEVLLKRVEQEIALRKESFQLNQATRASSAVVPILKWIQAAQQYGQVLVKLKPLSESMRGLEDESDTLLKSMHKIEQEHRELDDKLATDKTKLEKLQTSFKSAQDASEKVKLDLERAQGIMSNLDDQLKNWRSKLLVYDKLSLDDSEKLFTSSLIGSLISSYARDLKSVDKLLADLSGVLSNTDLSSHKLLEGDLGLILESVDEESAVELAVYAKQSPKSVESLDHLMKLIILKLNFHFNMARVPLLSVDPALTNEELIQYLSFKRILCSSTSKLVIVKSDDNWRRQCDLALQVGDRILLIEIDSSLSQSLLLDIIEFVVASSSQQAHRRIILFSSSREKQTVSAISQLTCSLDIQNSESGDAEDIESAKDQLSDYLMEFREPTIKSEVSALELRLADEQRQARRLETDLMRTLVAADRQGAQASQGELGRLLNELRVSRQVLESNIGGITRKLEELRARRSAFEGIARQAAEFYGHNLSGASRKLDNFYNLSRRSFSKLVHSSTVVNDGRSSIDWTQLLIGIMRSMRSYHRNAFCEQLLTSGHRLGEEDVRGALARAADFKFALESLTTGDAAACHLAIIMHDAAKSSPLLELNELMRGRRTNDQLDNSFRDLDLNVLHATSDSNLLEGQFERIIDAKRGNGAGKLQCVCIANSHLASDWLNMRLLDKLKKVSETRTARLLVILVAEGASEPECNFSSNLLDATDLRFWYDELMLGFVDRFRMYARLIENTNREGILLDRQLARQLVLLHVVCQELIKRADDAEASGVTWQLGQKYNFDYGQLSLAVKILGNLSTQVGDSAAASLRDTFCHYLSEVVYGSRMESTRDEELLELLLKTFLGDPKRASHKLSDLDKLLGVEPTDKRADRLLADLIAV